MEIKKYKSELFQWGDAFVVSLTIVVILFVFCFKLVGVRGQSMEPTLYENDFLITSDLFYTPSYGDIVIIKKESFDSDSIVKRVIATEGQEIYVDYENNQVFVDGVLLDEPYTNQEDPDFIRGDVTYPQIVPEGHVFVMGDNRGHSTDSRDSRLGFVDERLILGEVLFRIAPFDSFGKVE